jgi:RNA polymerase sigma-70 factor (ECF subfamily)
VGEDRLLKRARTGDREALDALCRREWRSVYAIVYAAVRDRQEAEDLTQDVFVRALNALDRYQETDVPFRAYLAAIARNRVRDRWRKRQFAQVGLEHAPELLAHDRPDVALAGLPLAVDINEAILELPEDYRTVLQLRLWEDRSSEEVARLMGRSAGAVRVLQYRALAALRRTLEEEPHR